MSKKRNLRKGKRKGSAFIPKRHVYDEIKISMNGAKIIDKLRSLNNSRLDEASHNKIMHPIYYALLMLKEGKASTDDMALLFQSSLFAYELIDRITPFSDIQEDLTDFRKEISGVDEILEAIHTRGLPDKRFIATEQEIESINYMIRVLDAVSVVCTLNHLSTALNRSVEELNVRREIFFNSKEGEVVTNPVQAVA